MYKSIKKSLLRSLTFLTLITLSSCGYNYGSIGNHQIKTIAIAPIKNETYYQDLSTYMKQMLSETFQKDGAFKVRRMYDSDAILYGRITYTNVESKNILTAQDGVTYMTNVFEITVYFEFTVVIPGRVRPFIPTTKIEESAQFQVPVDLNPARQSGLQQACRNVAEKTVWYCSEGF